MKKVNAPVGIVFSLLCLVNLLTGDWLAATTSALLAAGFWLSDLAYAPALACGDPSHNPLPVWRRYASILLVGGALVVFAFQIGHDIGTKLSKTPAPAGPNVRPQALHKSLHTAKT